jgi:hypothetical protein
MFYQNMARLIRLLRLAVEYTDYDPAATANRRRRHADLFWVPVCGERTEGHPNYRK